MAARNDIRVGIAGVGNISEIHAQAIKEAAGGKLVAAHSRNREKLDRFCRSHGIDAEPVYEDLVSRKDLDLVAVCTPSGTHLDYGLAAAQAGKHLVIEKPIEVTLERAASLLDQCRNEGVQLAVIYQNRFIDDIRRMREAVINNTIGIPFMATAEVKWFRSQEYYEEGGWRGTLRFDGGGAVINQSIHTVDLLEWMLGPVDTVQGLKGTFTHTGIEGEDNAVAAIRFSSGVIATFTASTSIRPAQPRTLRIHGEDGTAELIDNSFQLHLPDSEETLTDHPEKPASGADDPMANLAFEPHRRQYEEIFRALAEGHPPVVSGPESLHSLATVSALYRSSEIGRAVSPKSLLAEATGKSAD